MKYTIISIFLLSLALGDLACLQSEVYVKFLKQSKSNANEESFYVTDGTTVLYSSPVLVANQLRIIEFCLPEKHHNQYILELRDKYGNNWAAGSWLRVEGEYGNAVFKNYLSQKSLDSYRLSLYMPIKKASTWMLISGSVSGSWKEFDYPATGWTEVTLRSVTTSVSGTQYFRKTFTGITEMAAYELRMNYRYGVVAYINGLEIFRDNMLAGDVVSTTEASGSYAEVGYHGVIRPAKEVTSSNSILAVELHWMNDISPTTVDFDAFVAIMAPTAIGTQCFIYADDVTLSSNIGSSPQNAFNYGRTDSFSYVTLASPIVLNYGFDGSTPYVNGLRFWPYTSPARQPATFVWSGSNSVDSSDVWTNVISATGAVYTVSEYKVFNGFFNSGLFEKYRITISSTSSNILNIYEMHPMICSVGIPTDITFAKTSYSYYAKFEPVYIRPIVEEFTGCTVANLPVGLTIDSVTCIITGIVTAVLPVTSYTMTTIRDGVTYTGAFSLQTIECVGTLTNIFRSYHGMAYKESFSIKDTITNQVVLSVENNSGQTSYQDWTTVLCLTGSKYTVNLGCDDAYWSNLSYLFVYAVLSGDEMETITRINYDTILGLPASYVFNIKYSIPPSSQWFYKMSSIPATWTDTSVTGWEPAASVFPAPTNQLQFYKKQFDVTSLENVAGFVVSIRYIYGCLIYVNGNEVFRNGVIGDITTASVADTMYNDVLFHQITLPIRTLTTATIPSVDYLHTGSNTIAIALVAIKATQTTVNFDCAVRLMGNSAESRSFDVTLTALNINGYNNALSPYYTNAVYYLSCLNNHFDIIFNNDRRETITSIEFQLYHDQTNNQVRQFTILARNKGSDEWTTITNISQLIWSLKGQSKKIWIENSKSWNQYRFQDFASGVTACSWKFSRLDLIIDSTAIDIPVLTYPSVIVFQDVEMGEVYPSSSLYRAFSITPVLPDGLTIDPTSGIIAGTATNEKAATVHTITAKKVTGGESITTTVSVTVDICYGGKNLITLVVRADNWPSEMSYKLYRGKGVGGTVASSIDQFKNKAALNYGDFCEPHGIYTVELCDKKTHGWYNPAGYYLTIDLGTMIFEMGQVPKRNTAPVLVTTMFSSYLPFQINFDSWRVWSSSDAVAVTWKDNTFDDELWRNIKAADIGTTEAKTVYIRKSVDIPSIDDYQVLNIRMRYSGGIAVHFNGRLVARFNLEEDFTSESDGLLPEHDPSEFVKFHIILVTASGVTGKNVIAFEIHRQKGQQTSIPVVFDATGVFGVNICSPVVDTITILTGSDVTSTTLEGIFDLNPVTYGYQQNVAGTFNEWTVANLEGSRFNSFAMQTSSAVTSYGFTLYGRKVPEVEEAENIPYETLLETVNAETKDRERSAWDAPLAVIGFRQMRFNVDDTASSIVAISSYIMQFCRATGDFCKGIGDYPAVGNGQISPSSCDYGFKGYSYRICTGGTLGDVIKDKCINKIPLRLTYLSQTYRFIKDIKTETDKPTYDNLITKFDLDKNVFLPTGLILNPVTGVISGTPITISDLKAYTIYGSNDVGATSVTISIAVRYGECKAEGVFERTVAGEIAVYQCSLQGNYIGTQSRACVLGAVDGEWGKQIGGCTSVMLIIILVIIVIIIVAVIIFFVVRSSRRAKAVGGVKGKKSVISNKKMGKKVSSKTIKV